MKKKFNLTTLEPNAVVVIFDTEKSEEFHYTGTETAQIREWQYLKLRANHVEKFDIEVCWKTDRAKKYDLLEKRKILVRGEASSLEDFDLFGAVHVKVRLLNPSDKEVALNGIMVIADEREPRA